MKQTTSGFWSCAPFPRPLPIRLSFSPAFFALLRAFWAPSHACCMEIRLGDARNLEVMRYGFMITGFLLQKSFSMILVRMCYAGTCCTYQETSNKCVILLRFASFSRFFWQLIMKIC